MKGFRMLAYVFWHTPASLDGTSTYETALAAFHQTLRPADIRGFHGSHAWLVQGATWISSPVAYEDWYLVDDFTALGVLNEAAVSGHRRQPHGDVASLAGEGKGMAGVYALCRGGAQSLDAAAGLLVRKASRQVLRRVLRRTGRAKVAVAAPDGPRADARVLLGR